MALERAPAAKFGKPAELQRFRPAGNSVRLYHTVESKDQNLSWIAAHYKVSVVQLIGLNFPGSVENGRVVPEVVNWYLHYHESFRCPETQDKKNRIFRGGERIAVPAVLVEHIDIEDPLEVVVPAKPLNLWFGLGVKGGGHFFVIGKDAFEGYVWSWDNFANQFGLEVDGWRVGPGLGGAGGLAVVVVTGLESPYELKDHPMDGKDFQLALGAKLSGVAKALKEIPWVTRFIQGWKHGKKVSKAAMTFAEWEKTRDAFKQILLNMPDVINLNPPTPQVVIMEIPGGGPGLEISLFYGWGLANVYSVEYTKPARSGPPL